MKPKRNNVRFKPPIRKTKPVPITQNEVARVRKLCRQKMTPALAKDVLSWRLSKADQRRLHLLLDKNQESTISPAEHDWLCICVLLGDLVGILMSKARVLLKTRRNKPIA
jgi:hypothetical protein